MKPRQKNYAKCSKITKWVRLQGKKNKKAGGRRGKQTFSSPICASAPRQSLSFTARDQFRYHLHTDNSTDTFRVSLDLLHHLWDQHAAQDTLMTGKYFTDKEKIYMYSSLLSVANLWWLPFFKRFQSNLDWTTIFSHLNSLVNWVRCDASSWSCSSFGMQYDLVKTSLSTSLFHLIVFCFLVI